MARWFSIGLFVCMTMLPGRRIVVGSSTTTQGGISWWTAPTSRGRLCGWINHHHPRCPSCQNNRRSSGSVEGIESRWSIAAPCPKITGMTTAISLLTLPSFLSLSSSSSLPSSHSQIPSSCPPLSPPRQRRRHAPEPQHYQIPIPENSVHQSARAWSLSRFSMLTHQKPRLDSLVGFFVTALVLLGLSLSCSISLASASAPAFDQPPLPNYRTATRGQIPVHGSLILASERVLDGGGTPATTTSTTHDDDSSRLLDAFGAQLLLPNDNRGSSGLDAGNGGSPSPRPSEFAVDRDGSGRSSPQYGSSSSSSSQSDLGSALQEMQRRKRIDPLTHG